MRLMDVMLALPSLLLAIAVVAILGPGLANAMYAIAIVLLPHYVRLTRAAVIAEAGREYVTSSRIAGAGTLRLMFSTILPNCAAPLIVQATLGFSNAILDAAALGFLGLGAQPPTPEWGSMLASRARVHPARAVGRHVPGPRDPDHGARVQPDGRRPARRARPEAAQLARMSADSRAARNRRPARRVRHAAAPGASPSTASTSSIDAGEVVGLVGESGSGKSVTALALLGLVDFPGRVRAQADGVRRPRPASTASRGERRALVGTRHRDDLPGSAGEPRPVLHGRLPARRGAAAARQRRGAARAPSRAASARSQLLREVEIADPPARLRAYPHQLSGGMAQRVMIAMAIAGQSAAADRRRADDGARRHRAGAGARAADAAAARARHGAAADHARPRRRRRDRAIASS